MAEPLLLQLLEGPPPVVMLLPQRRRQRRRKRVRITIYTMRNLVTAC